MAWTIKGQLKSPNPERAVLAGCRVEAFFQGARPLPARASALTDRLGEFELSLPDRSELAGALRFVVSAPSGETIGERDFAVNDVPETVEIAVLTLEPIPLTRPTAVPKPETRRITGRIIERNGKLLPANLQILLFARRKGENAGPATDPPPPILVVRADGSGYFFGQAPNEEYESAIALVAGFDDEFLVAIEKDFIASPVLLVVDLADRGEGDPGKDDCACDTVKAPPRTPSQVDIDNAPDGYSTDLGTGRCVQFNTPNRAIEEFDFYTVIRTTEPDIRGLTVQGPSRAEELAAEAAAAEAAAATAASAVETAKAAVVTATAATATAEANQAEAERLYLEAQAEGGASNLGELLDAMNASQAATEAARKVEAAARTKLTKAQTDLAAAQAVAASKRAKADAAAEAAAGKPPGRVHLDASNPVDWDASPTFFEAATISHGHLLHFKQTWHADGYSLGDLLYSLPLAPGQKKLISVVDWERRERTERNELTIGDEAVTAAISRDRDLGEVVTGTLTESSRGGSRNTTAGVGAGTGGAGNGSYQGFNFGALLGISGGYGESQSSAWQESARNLSSNSLQTLRDRTLQSASAVRGLRSSVVHTVAQGEAVRATTEVVANHNHCHAVTVQYFEVLRHLKLVHELTDVQECLLVPLPMKEFDRAKALRWRQPLQTYLQRRELLPGFDATRRVDTGWSEVDYPLARYGDEAVMSLAGELLLTVMIPLPPFPERPKPDPEDTAAEIAQKMADAVNPTVGPVGILLGVLTGGASLVAGAVTSAAIEAGKAAAKGARAVADELFQLNPQERYEKFHQEILPGIVEAFVDQLQLWAIVGSSQMRINDADFTLVSAYQPGVPLLVSMRANVSGRVRRADITQLIVKSANGLAVGCRAIVNAATVRYRTQSFEHSLVNDQRVNDDIDLPKMVASFTGFDFEIKTIAPGRGAALFAPMDEWEQRSPRLEDQRLSAELIDHLNDGLEYYHHVIWWTMDPNRRYMLLDGFLAPGSNDRSVASVVENRLIGIVGNSFVLPVARGNHLDPRFRPGAEGESVNLLDFYALSSPVPPARVSLPTRGVFAEAVMGSCNACEEIDDTRFWRWEDSPTDEPPAIEAASTTTRRSEPPNALPTTFPTPIVSIQNVPSAPDPAGVRAALDTVAKQSFTDITGLAGTQANAAAAYSQALDTAFKFGKEASTLAQQAAMLKNVDKTMKSIDKADSEGKIDAAEAKKLRVTALEKMVGKPAGELSPKEVAERVKLVDELAAGDSISQDQAQALNNSALRSLVNGDSEDLRTAGDLIGELPDGSSITAGGGGPTIIRTGFNEADGEVRTAPTHIRGLSRLGDKSGEGTSTMSQLWDGSKSLLEAVADGVADWKDKPDKELSDAVGESIRTAALAAADDVTDKFPLVKAFKVGVKLSLAFADGVGAAMERESADLKVAYRPGELAGAGGEGLTPEDVLAINHIRSWQANSVGRLRTILLDGVAAVVEEAVTQALTWVGSTAVKAAGGVAKQLVGRYLTKSGVEAMLANAVATAGKGIPLARQSAYREIVTTVMGLYIRQLDDAQLRGTLKPLAKLGADANKPLEKMLLSALASLLLDPVIKKVDQGLRKTIVAKAKALADEIRAAGQSVSPGAALSANDDGVTLPRSTFIEIENGPEAARAQEERDLEEFQRTMQDLQEGARALAQALNGMRQRGLVLEWQRGDVHLWNRYVDEHKQLFLDLDRAARNLLAGLDPAVRTIAEEERLPLFLVLPRLYGDDPRRIQDVQYDRKTGAIRTGGFRSTRTPAGPRVTIL